MKTAIFPTFRALPLVLSPNEHLSHLSFHTTSAAPICCPTPCGNVSCNSLRNGVDPVRQHKDMLVETFYQRKTLKALLKELARDGSDPVELIRRDGDWTKEHLWTAISFLLERDRINDALKVFETWKNIEASRASELNYLKIIRMLCERSLMKEAISLFEQMEGHGLAPSRAIYNSIISGFASEKNFDDANGAVQHMLNAGIAPKPETYYGLIRSYGTHKLYDEMAKCVRWMKSVGCYPDETTYNMLVTEFAVGGLVVRMEKAYRTLLAQKMNILPSTAVAMLEVYADLEILDKMEMAYRKVLKLKAFMKESLIKKVAQVYIKNRMYSRLEQLANDISSLHGRTELIWCILLLSSACSVSRKGVESIIREMEVTNQQFCVTSVNIIAHFYLKVRDFGSLERVLSRIWKPDILTIGILFDACEVGFDGTHVLEKWMRRGCLREIAKMETDTLVISAFGKGNFLVKCEKIYSSLELREQKGQQWTYSDLFNFTFKGMGH